MLTIRQFQALKHLKAAATSMGVTEWAESVRKMAPLIELPILTNDDLNSLDYGYDNYVLSRAADIVSSEIRPV